MAITTLLRHLANIAAPGLLFLSPFLVFVRFHDYPIWRPEILVVALALIGLGMPFGLLIAIRPKTFGAAALTVLVLVCTTEVLVSRYPDSLTAWDSFLQSVVDWGGSLGLYAVLGLGAVVVVGGLIALFGLLGRNLGIVMSTVFGVAAASTVLLPTEATLTGEIFRKEVQANSSLPLIIHLVLDEHMGIEGLPAEIDGSETLREDLMAFYRDYGFQVWARAFSQYTQTRNNLASIFNARPSADERSPDGREQRSSELRDNLWFRHLADQGYRIRIYYIEEIDFCGAENKAVSSCFVYRGNSVGALVDTEIPALSAAKIVSGSFLNTFTLFNILGRQWLKDRGWQDLLPKWLMTRSVVGVPPSLEILSQIREDLKRSSGGTAIFAHLIIPHHTYNYDRECRIKADTDKWSHSVSFVDVDIQSAVINSPESRRQHYRGYFDQLGCLYRALREFLDDLEASGLLQDATIILHGDHGSRISLLTPNRDSAERLSDADLVDNYSVLYAVRRPGSRPAYDLNLRSIQSLFAEMFLERRYPDDGPVVVLDDWLQMQRAPPSDSRVRVPMPDFGGCGGAC